MRRPIGIVMVLFAALGGASSVRAECNTSTQELADCFPGAEEPERWELTDEQIIRNEDPHTQERVEEGLISDPDEGTDEEFGEGNSVSAQ